MGILHHQLPAYSPVPLRGIVRSATAAARLSTDARPSLVSLLKREYRADEVVLCGSGTQALQLAISMAKKVVESPGIVALPAYSCFDVVTAAVGSDSKALFYDIDPDSLGPDMDSLEQALGDGARIVVITPLFGYPVDWDAIGVLVSAHGALAIEDAAQGHEAKWRGERLGSLGRLSVLSFGRGKGWTGGRGGALLLRQRFSGNRRAADSLADPGMLSDVLTLGSVLAQWSLGRASLYALPAAIPWLGLGVTRYHDPRPVRRMCRSAASVVVGAHARASAEAVIRKVNAGVLLERLSGNANVQKVTGSPLGEPGFLRLPVRLSRGLSGFSSVQRALRLGVGSGYPAVLPSLPQVQGHLLKSEARWPGGEELVQRLVTLPTHSRATAVEREELSQLLDRYPAVS